MKKFKPVYKRKYAQGVQAITPRTNSTGYTVEYDNSLNPYGLSQTRQEANIDAGIDMGLEVAAATIPVYGQIAKAGNQLTKTIKGDGTDGIKNTIANSISPMNNFKSLISGNFKDAIPIVGGFNEAKRRKKEQKEAEAQAKFQAAKESGNAKVVQDSTKYQAMAKYGKRFDSGTDGIKDPKGKRGKGIKKATIPVEVERNEMVFRKSGNNWMLVQDFKGGLTHEQGGEDTVVQKGDVIIPGNKRTKIMKLLDSTGKVAKEYLPTFESERLKLPTDTKDGEAAEGLNAEGYSALAQLPTVLYNIAEGSKPAEKTKRRYFNPQKVKFVDTSAEKLKEADETFRADVRNITGKSGGNSGVFLSNVGAAGSRRNRFKNQVLTQKAQEAQNVEAMNTQIENQAEQYNVGLDLQFDNQDAQNQAAKRAFNRQAVTDASSIGQQYIKNKGLRERDEKLIELEEKKLNILNSLNPNFMVDTDFNVNYKEEKVNPTNLKNKGIDLGLNKPNEVQPAQIEPSQVKNEFTGLSIEDIFDFVNTKGAV